MSEEKRFVGGSQYRLSELFSGSHRAIVIPDLQRDYCWGDSVHTPEHKDLVNGFVSSLIEMFVNLGNEGERRDDFSLGLVYGYEQPFDQLQLCDGQQRITTLFLLLGMLNRHLGDDSLKKYLISNYEEEDDREPYLRYSIRESSLYFMSDLVCRFFICGGRANWPVAVSDIRNEAWYFNDYERDPSIRSMLRALDIIESQIGMHSDVDWNAFAEFLLNRLTFMYYDMGSRENGEETFVVINTTGEPLSVAQNLKPRVSGARINEAEENLIARWEEIETWFWQKRCNDNDTADAGMGEFLRWVTLLHYIDKRDDEMVSLILESGTYSFPVNEIGFKKVYSAFGAVRNIYEKYKGCDDSLADPDHLSPSRTKWCLELNELYKFLPVVRYVERFEEATSLDVCRVFRYFQNVAGYLSKDITVKNRSVSQAVRLVTEMAGKDILSFLGCEDASKHILPDEERRKLEILAEASAERENLEKIFWQVQGFRLFLGEITPILDWSMRDGSFDPELFGLYVAKVVDCIEADGKARDLVRRALLSYELDGYPVRNGKNLSFCGEDWQWKRITSENSCRIKSFLDELIAGVDVQSIIGRCASGSKWYGVAADAAVLNYCEEKNIQEDMSEGIILIKKKRATTWFPMRLLDDTRERFGAEEILYFNSRSIGFKRTIDGRVMYFQRWLDPGEGEVDLYLMRSADPESYVEGEDVQGENDLAKYVCMEIADEMDSGEISGGIRLMAHKGSDAADIRE